MKTIAAIRKALEKEKIALAKRREVLGPGEEPFTQLPDGWADDVNRLYGKPPSALVEGGEKRPPNCRFRLQDEGKAYPRSSCAACGKTITTGLGKGCTFATPPSRNDTIRECELAVLGQIGSVRDWSEDEMARMRREDTVDVARATARATIEACAKRLRALLTDEVTK